MNKTWIWAAALFASPMIHAQDAGMPVDIDNVAPAAEYNIWENGFENVLDSNIVSASYNLDPLGYDSSTVASNFSTFNTEDDDPGGPGGPTNDLPINGGLSLLLAAGLGAGYRSYRQTYKKVNKTNNYPNVVIRLHSTT